MWKIFTYISIIVSSETIAQFLIKQSNNVGNYHYHYLLLGIFFYSLVAYSLHLAYNEFPLSKVNVIWSSFTIIFSILFGCFIYNEHINYKTIIAAMLSMISIWLVYIS